MNDLYTHQLETENKQLREQLKLCRNAINEIKEELSKTIDAKDKIINEQVLEIARLKDRIESADEFCDRYMGVNLDLFDMYELLNKIREILGDKDIEFDVLKALNTDLPDDIEMG